MNGSLPILLTFFAGCAAGVCGLSVDGLHDLSVYILYALMFQVGLSIGSSDNLSAVVRTFRPRMLLIPLATVCGTLTFAAATSFALSHLSLADTLAVSGGLGYYSLSSVLITQLKQPTLGAQAAAELGTIALLTNVCRELLALMLAPFIFRRFGKLALVCAAGVTSVDVCLPTIARLSGKEFIPIALFHGMVLDMSVPFLVSLFCGW